MHLVTRLNSLFTFRYLNNQNTTAVRLCQSPYSKAFQVPCCLLVSVSQPVVPWSGHPSHYLRYHAPWICKGHALSYDLRAVYQSIVYVARMTKFFEQAFTNQRGTRLLGCCICKQWITFICCIMIHAYMISYTAHPTESAVSHLIQCQSWHPGRQCTPSQHPQSHLWLHKPVPAHCKLLGCRAEPPQSSWLLHTRHRCQLCRLQLPLQQSQQGPLGLPPASQHARRSLPCHWLLQMPSIILASLNSHAGAMLVSTTLL